MQTLYIIRGIPGSGKSTYAQKALAGISCYEADQYFIRPDGKYDFNARLLKEAHQWCKNEVEMEMDLGKDVVVANTFTRKWEMQAYIDLASKHNYNLKIIRCVGAYKNVHGVPDDKVQEMFDRFEDYCGEVCV